MKKLPAFIFLFFISLLSHSQYWQQKVDFIIDATLNDREKTIDAFERINYQNNSPDTLHFIWFHVWPNAYKNDRTAFSDQLLENGDTRFYFSNTSERGYINRLDFKVDGTTAKLEDHPQHIDIVKLILPEPLMPGKNITITTPFHVKLPFNFSRGGYDGETFQVTQWFPKPAVYDKNGWHPMPYLDQGEFYSEFGNYDVRITLPSNYVVAATGDLENEEEKQWLEERQGFKWNPIVTKVKSSNGKNAPLKKITQKYPATSPHTKTLRYQQENVHDFAWFADKRFIVHHDTCLLASGRVIQVYTYYIKPLFKLWENSFKTTKDAIRFYSSEIGEYPYNTVSIVYGPESFGGGMEYPTITVISPIDDEKDLARIIAHEIGHNWFQGMLASNERSHPWMDEGLNSFYEQKYMRAKYGDESSLEKLLYRTKAHRHTTQPIATSSEKFSSTNYGLVAYYRTAEWLREVESAISEDSLRKIMQDYFYNWKFKHPQPVDFLSLVNAAYIEKADGKGDPLSQLSTVTTVKSTGFQFVSPFKKGSIKKYLQSPNTNVLWASPSFGVNSYDRLMIGALFTNYKLPPTKFNFLITPMYATGSKRFSGLGKLNYSIITNGSIRKTDFFVNASNFSMDEFRDTADRKLIMRFKKLVPGFKMTFREQNPRSTVTRFLQWKTYLFNEQSLSISRDTAISGTDTSFFLRYLLPEQNRYLNQLRFVYQNSRALYPFEIDMQVEQARDFIRPAVTANYFFNYRKGGLQLRFFAGGFFYLNGKTLRKQFENDRYHLNMTAPNGYEDYTYSGYFLGRNHFEGTESQQVIIRDGGFKVRTDLLASKVGKTDRWLTAVNLNSTIPDKINPLSVLPVKIPLRIFLDIGTYAEAWDKDSEEDRLLYNLGLQLSLFNETLNIYLPLFYNKVYGDYLKSTIPKNRFLKTISFSINFYNRDIQKLNRELEF